MTIKLRGHHLIAIKDYLKEDGSAESFFKNRAILLPEYGAKHFLNEYDIVKRIRYEKEQIYITDSLDDFCKQCNKKNLSCKDKLGSYLDKIVAENFELELDKEYNPGYIIRKLKSSKGLKKTTIAKGMGVTFMMAIKYPVIVLKEFKDYGCNILDMTKEESYYERLIEEYRRESAN